MDATFDELVDRFIPAIQSARTSTLRQAIASWRGATKNRHLSDEQRGKAERVYDLLKSELSRRAD